MCIFWKPTVYTLLMKAVCSSISSARHGQLYLTNCTFTYEHTSIVLYISTYYIIRYPNSLVNFPTLASTVAVIPFLDRTEQLRTVKNRNGLTFLLDLSHHVDDLTLIGEEVLFYLKPNITTSSAIRCGLLARCALFVNSFDWLAHIPTYTSVYIRCIDHSNRSTIPPCRIFVLFVRREENSEPRLAPGYHGSSGSSFCPALSDRPIDRPGRLCPGFLRSNDVQARLAIIFAFLPKHFARFRFNNATGCSTAACVSEATGNAASSLVLQLPYFLFFHSAMPFSDRLPFPADRFSSREFIISLYAYRYLRYSS